MAALAVKRFWREARAVEGEGGWIVELDGRPLRTPARAPLALPTHALAEAIVAEWQAVETEIRPGSMPLTGLANAAIDRTDLALAAALAAYGESDLVCYRAETPPELAAAQSAAWDPLVAWAAERYDVRFEIVAGVTHRGQPATTIARLRAAVEALDRFALAGMHPIVTVSGSLVIALALRARTIDVATAWAAGQLDELWQAERWGEDDLAIEARLARRAALSAGAAFLELSAR